MRHRATPALFVALLSLVGAACVTRPCRSRAGARPGALPSGGADYALPGPVPPARLALARSGRAWRSLRVVLPSRAAPDAPDVAREPVRMTWFQPVGFPGRRPAVVVSPILGSETTFVTPFAERFAREGWHALIVARPEVTYDPARALGQVEERLRAAVSGQVQALDWLLAQPDVDARRIASFGISAGGIQGAMVAGADPRYVAHVFALAGGPLADVFVDTEEDRLAELVEQGMRREAVDRGALRERLRAVIRTDPVTLAAGVPPERVLLVLARFDRAVPYAHGRRLEEALGGPETVVLPLGHYSSVVLLPFLQSRVLAFLHARFDAALAGGDLPAAPAETGDGTSPGIPSRGPPRSPP